MNTSKGPTLFPYIITPHHPFPNPDIVVGFDARLIGQNRGERNQKEWN